MEPRQGDGTMDCARIMGERARCDRAFQGDRVGMRWRCFDLGILPLLFVMLTGGCSSREDAMPRLTNGRSTPRRGRSPGPGTTRGWLPDLDRTAGGSTTAARARTLPHSVNRRASRHGWSFGGKPLSAACRYRASRRFSVRHTAAAAGRPHHRRGGRHGARHHRPGWQSWPTSSLDAAIRSA